eukprot:Sdes_comp18518_c0_seq1m8562
MLAENSRRKMKWSQDPNNTNWSQDEGKFGFKMLEKMGWKKGKGLGISEQGKTDFVKVKRKEDSFGIGAKINHSNNWLEHQNAFDEILSRLNSKEEHVEEKELKEEVAEEKTSCLETKMKNSKRLFYSKFVKNKNVSQYSEIQVANIFGRKPVKKGSGEKCDEFNEDQKKSGCVNSILPIVESSVNMNDYFSQKMKLLKDLSEISKGENLKMEEKSETLKRKETFQEEFVEISGENKKMKKENKEKKKEKTEKKKEKT